MAMAGRPVHALAALMANMTAFRAGVAEADALHSGHSRADQLGKFGLLLGRVGKTGSVAQLSLKRCDDGCEGVTMDQRGEVGVQVQKFATVGIEQIRATSVTDVAGNRIPLDRHPRGAIGEHLAGPTKGIMGARPDNGLVVLLGQR